MSLVIQSLMTGNAAAGNTQAANAGAGTAGGTAAVQPFAQTLVQTMSGNTAQAAPQIQGGLASLLMRLLGAVQQPGSESGGQEDQQIPADSLKGLTEELEKLDDQIASDPALQAALQSWIMQIPAMLSGAGSQQASDAGTAGSEAAQQGLPPLAQHSATLRFAIQDELNSLVNMVQQAAANGDEVTAVKGAEMVKQLAELLDRVAPPVNPSHSASATNVQLSTAIAEQLQGAEGKDKSQDKAGPVLNPRTPETIAVKSAAPTSGSDVNGSQQGLADKKAETPAASGVKPSEVDTLKVFTKEEQSAQPEAGDHEIVTAGQLSMRSGVTALHRAELSAPQVPVQHFAQEMTGFITGKLEIVKRGSAAEATITLFPEHLGQVDVKITMQNGHLIAQFVTEHAAAKDMLEQQMTQLRSALQSQGLQVEKLEVTQNNTPLQSQFGQDSRQPGAGGQQQPGSNSNRSKQRNEDSGDAVLAAELTGEWREWAAGDSSEEQGHGGSFSAKA